MSKFLIRIYDHKIRTNYIERVFEANDHLDALNKIKVDKDVLREARGKLSTNDTIPEVIDKGSYELIELE